MLKFVDGFDSYSVAGDLIRKYSGASAGVSGSGGRFGGGALTLTVGQYVHKIFTPTSATEAAYAFSFKASAKPTNTNGFFQIHHQASGFDGWNTNGHWLQINTNGTLSVYYIYGGNSVLTSTTDICDGSWHWIEVKLKVANSGGECQVYIDGALEMSHSGDTDNNSGPTYFDRFLFKNAQGGGQTWTIDDFVLYDTAAGTLTGDLTVASNFPLGDCRVETLRPTGAGNSTDFAPSAGANYEAVDEVAPNGDTDYVSDNTSGQKDLYAHGNLSGTPASIKAVVINTVARNSDTGLASLRGTARSGTTETDSDTKTLTANYKTYQFNIPQDPNTSAAWTGSGVDGAEFGFEIP